jgi:hypothetical protein
MKTAVVLLVAALVVSNVWWAYRVLDCGVSLTYRDASLSDHQIALEQAIAVLPVVARVDHDRAAVLAAAHSSIQDPSEFEKEGYVWVGRLGFRFGSDGRLIGAKRAWE